VYVNTNENLNGKQVQIYNAVGLQLNEMQFENQMLILDKSRYLSGIYFLKIENSNQIIKLVME
jgi:hypothetical protein